MSKTLTVVVPPADKYAKLDLVCSVLNVALLEQTGMGGFVNFADSPSSGFVGEREDGHPLVVMYSKPATDGYSMAFPLLAEASDEENIGVILQAYCLFADTVRSNGPKWPVLKISGGLEHAARRQQEFSIFTKNSCQLVQSLEVPIIAIGLAPVEATTITVK